jgi:hypothetical protein
MSDGRVKVRPITIMALLAVAALVAAGVYAWVHPSGTTGTPAALPITIGSSTAARASGMADVAIAPVRPTIFVAAPGLPALDGSAHAWRVAGAAPDDAAVARLGRAFGLHGAVHTQDGGWTMGVTGGPQLVVSAAGTHAWSWTFNPSATVSSPAVACARPLAGSAAIGAGDTVATAPCGPTATAAPPEGVPDQAAAEQRARSVLDAAGFDLRGWKVTSVADAYSATVTASPVLDGVEVEGLTMSVSFGPHGPVTYASGWFGPPQQADSYPLVGTKVAIAHLQKGDAFGIEPMTGRAGVPELATPNRSTYSTGAVTTDTVGTTVAGPPDSSSGSAPGSAGDHAGSVPTTSGTVPPTTTAAPVTITIDRAEMVLAAQVGTDGSMWLVPAYLLSATSGGTWTVLAVDRKYVAPPRIDPGPMKTIEPWGGGSTGGGTGSGGSGTGVATPATDTVGPCCGRPGRSGPNGD